MPVSRNIPTLANPDLVSFSIKVNGAIISQTVQVARISIQKAINKIPTAKIKLFDGIAAQETFPQSNTETFLPGNAIDLSLGYHSKEAVVFKGIITAHSNKVSSSSSELTIECRDVVVKMTVGRNSKHFNEVTDSDVAEQLIGNYSGVTAQVEATSIKHKDLVQFNVTDWDFIVSRMDVIGCICLVNDGTFVIKKPSLGEDAKLEVLFGATILEYNGTIDAKDQFGGVEATSWNFSEQELTQTDAAEPQWSEGGNVTNSTLADTIELEKFKLIHSGTITREALQAWADAKLMKNRLSKIRGSVKYQGNADVTPGNFIGLNGVGDRFNGKALVSAVTHVCEDGNWTTEVQFGLDPQWFAETIEVKNPASHNGLIPSMQGLQIGVVTDLEDPLGENRVRVKIPVISTGEEGIWVRVATLDAGNNRGSFFLPEIGDEVIIGFLNNDPNYAIMLGMLNSSAKPAALTASNDNHEKGYISRADIRMIFNDEQKSYKLSTPAGNKITLSDNDSNIVIEDQHGNKITMESAGITIESASAITLKAATDLTIEAVNVTISPSANFSVGAGGCEIKAGSGSASLSAPQVKVEGSGVTEIKGGLVQIN